MEKVICYANLNCFNSPDNVTDEHMQKFFIEALQKIPNKPALELIDIVIDRYTPNVHYMRREGWQKLLEICKNEKVDTIIVPTVQMVTQGFIDIVELFRNMRSTYDCDLYFMYEQIESSKEESEMLLNFIAVVEEEKNNLKKAERKLRGHFYDATQINREISAVPILIDNKIYEQMESFTRKFGEDVQTIMNWFFEVLVKPENCELFEKIMKWDIAE